LEGGESEASAIYLALNYARLNLYHRGDEARIREMFAKARRSEAVLDVTVVRAGVAEESDGGPRVYLVSTKRWNVTQWVRDESKHVVSDSSGRADDMRACVPSLAVCAFPATSWAILSLVKESSVHQGIQGIQGTSTPSAVVKLAKWGVAAYLSRASRFHRFPTVRSLRTQLGVEGLLCRDYAKTTTSDMYVNDGVELSPTEACQYRSAHLLLYKPLEGPVPAGPALLLFQAAEGLPTLEPYGGRVTQGDSDCLSTAARRMWIERGSIGDLAAFTARVRREIMGAATRGAGARESSGGKVFAVWNPVSKQALIVAPHACLAPLLSELPVSAGVCERWVPTQVLAAFADELRDAVGESAIRGGGPVPLAAHASGMTAVEKQAEEEEDPCTKAIAAIHERFLAEGAFTHVSQVVVDGSESPVLAPPHRWLVQAFALSECSELRRTLEDLA
jgi:hypothetical protein